MRNAHAIRPLLNPLPKVRHLSDVIVSDNQAGIEVSGNMTQGSLNTFLHAHIAGPRSIIGTGIFWPSQWGWNDLAWKENVV